MADRIALLAQRAAEEVSLAFGYSEQREHELGRRFARLIAKHVGQMAVDVHAGAPSPTRATSSTKH